MKRLLWIAFFALLLGSGWTRATAWSQPQANSEDPNVPIAAAEPARRESPVADQRPKSPVSATDEPANLSPNGTFIIRSEPRRGLQMERSLDQEFSNLVQKLKATENDQAKVPVIAKLRTILETAFDLDLKRREKDVSEIEGRVRKLREQIEKRKKAKEDIITLRLKTIANEADGLGFPTLNGSGNMRDGFYVDPMRSFRPGSGRGKMGNGGVPEPVLNSPEIESR